MNRCLTGADKKVQLVRDHSHAQYVFKLQKQLTTEYNDKCYTHHEHQQIKYVIQILHKKEETLRAKYTSDEWIKLGDYTIWG